MKNRLRIIAFLFLIALSTQTFVAMLGPSDDVQTSRWKAHQIFKRITSVGISVDAPIILNMEQRLNAGDELGAAELAVSDKRFLDLTVKEMFVRMSTREETNRIPFNDFAATGIGIVRDQLDARQLLTGNFYYRARAGTTGITSTNVLTDILESNNHYRQIGQRFNEMQFSISDILEKIEPQVARQALDNQAATIVNHPDPAGLLTSRTFMAAHSLAGTNRRIVEYAFREFLCVSIKEWSDNMAPDDMVGRDVDRRPGGEAAQFQSTCKACHSQLDSLRGAFAYYNAGDSDGDVQISFLRGNGARNVQGKYSRGSSNFSDGYVTVDDRWINRATGSSNAQLFGWRGPASGNGARAFGQMLAASDQFPRCMVERAFSTVCHRAPAATEAAMVLELANEFVSDNYNLRTLFKRVVIRDECLGGQE